jgi:hypothetical protein
MSPECYSRMHSACNCEDACTCICHLRDLLDGDDAQDIYAGEDEETLP